VVLCGTPGSYRESQTRCANRLEVDAVIEALVLAAVEVLVDPALPFGGLILGLISPVPVGVLPGLYSVVWRSISRQKRSGSWSWCVVSAAMSWAVRARTPCRT
jgi:hypothetical protein